jgi:hypothetical protein
VGTPEMGSQNPIFARLCGQKMAPEGGDLDTVSDVQKIFLGKKIFFFIKKLFFLQKNYFFFIKNYFFL